MNKATKEILSVLLIILVIAAVICFQFQKGVGEVDVPSSGNEYVVNFNELNENIYFHAGSWGVAGNHEEIILSTEPINENRKYSKDKDYIFYTSDVYYQKKGIDTLIIYAGLSSIGPYPKSFKSAAKVIIQELKNYDEVSDYDNNYKKYGLSKVTIYTDKE